MSLFTRRQDPSAPPPAGAGYSVLDAQLTMRGDLETDGTLRLDGRLEGSILRADVVVLGAGGTIVGNVRAREVIVGGRVEGHITATARVELQATAVVSGDIESAAIMIQEGGSVEGRLSVQHTVAAAQPEPRRSRKPDAAATAPVPAPALSPVGATGATASTPALTGTGH